jgi:predicted Zn-dependent peptidase
MYTKSALDNGLRVLTASVPHAYSVTVGAFVGAGSRYESDDMAGASHFLEHLLFKGTRSMPTAKQLSEAIESVGGLMNASTGFENTTLWCRVAQANLGLAVRVLSDMLRWPLMDADEIERERGVVVEEIRMSNDQPGYKVGSLIDSVIWPNHPLGRDIAGSDESVAGLERERLLKYYRNQYVPANTVVCVAGNINHGEVVAEVTRALGDWEEQRSLPWYPFDGDAQGSRLVTEHRETDQVHMCIGLPGLSRQHEDRRVLDLLNVALGDGMSSRLFDELREKRGLVYAVHSGTSYLRDCGSWVIYCGTEISNALQAAQIIITELEKLGDGLPPEELEKVKAMAHGRLLLQMESTSNLAVWGGSQELLTDRVKRVEEVVEEIATVEADDVRRVAANLISHDRLRMALVGPIQDEEEFRSLLGP